MSNELGIDRSGNNNNWTVNNMTLAADQVVDSPTNNFATLNPNWKAYFTDNYSYTTLSEGNLRADSHPTVNKIHMHKSTFRMAGKVYFEAIAVTQYYQIVGFGTFNWVGSSGLDDGAGNAAEGVNLYVNDGNEMFSYRQGGSQVNSSTNIFTINAGDVMQFAYDEDSGKGWVGINNTWYAADAGNDGDPAAGNNPTVTITAANRGDIYPGGADWASGNSTASGSIYNFGQDSSFAGNKTAQGNQDGNSIGDFYYTPPTGFLALCTSNLPDATVTPSEHFNTVLYTGNASTNAITGVGFQPDFVWTKNREDSYFHTLYDAVRGTGNTKAIHSNSTAAEGTHSAHNNLVSFDTNGFTLGATSSTSVQNYDDHIYVSWNWKANGSGSSNTNGSITSTVSANVDAGLSIVKYTSSISGSNGTATVGHGLSQSPEFIIHKGIDRTNGWWCQNVYTSHPNVMISLSGTGAAVDLGSYGTMSNPTSSVFSINGVDGVGGEGGEYIAYAFHSVDGYSKVGSYTGNGSTDGTFVYTGFRPAFILHKKTNGSANWIMTDAIRNTSNPVGKYLMPNSSNAEADGTSFFDYTSNGFKLRTSGGGQNGSGDTHIFIAFAETPFKYSNAR